MIVQAGIANFLRHTGDGDSSKDDKHRSEHDELERAVTGQVLRRVVVETR